MSEKSSAQNLAESHLRQLIENDATDWITRKKLAQLLYNDGKTKEAADVIWEAPEIPSIDLELGFAVKILGKGAPRKAIRLLTSIQELNKGKAVQNLGLANALMHYGMVMQAARFYGAALAEDPTLASPDLEHFLLWTDDKEKIWGNFKDDKPNLGELPWMKRDDREAEQLKKAMKGHTTPIKIPDLEEVTAEKIVHKMYEQSPRLNSDPTPPPAVTIPMDRVDAKHVVVDAERGAGQPETAEQASAAQGPTGGTTGQPLPVSDGAATVNPNVVRTAIAATEPPVTPEPAPTKMMVGGDATQSNSQMLADGKIVINPTTTVAKDKM
ncbi:MAG: tetratricopeptide repeat protein [Akkermansiaceae bacterium]